MVPHHAGAETIERRLRLAAESKINYGRDRHPATGPAGGSFSITNTASTTCSTAGTADATSFAQAAGPG